MEQSVYEAFSESEPPGTRPQRSGSPDAPVLPVYERRPNTAMTISARELALWRWANVDNLDLFLEDVYEYYVEKGFYCIVLARALLMATVLFVVVFSTYLYSCIDYSKIPGARELGDIRVSRCLARTSLFHKLLLWVFGVLWILKCFHYVSDVRRLWEMHDFFHHLLGIPDSEIQTISWQQVVEKLEGLRSINMTTTKRLDAHGIVNRIMRRENYMIALYNKNVLDLKVDLPFGGEYQFLTKTLEWSISLCIEDYVFNDRGQLRQLFLREDKRDMLAEGLRRRLQFAAIMNIVFAPIAVVYMSIYYFFRYFNDYRSNPKQLGTRQYTPLAEWKFRELNELYHLFKRRLSMSDQPAQRYISQFPRDKTELVVRFVIFVCSSFAAVLGMLSIYDPELLKLEIRPDQTVLFYLTTLGLIIAVARAMLSTPQEQAIYHPEVAMRQIVEFTHYLPDEWEGKLHTEPVKNAFCELYDLKPRIILRDLLSIFLNPIILGLKLADRSERVVDFFREFSINVDDLGGNVCSLAVFNTDQVNKVKARSDALDRFYATQDGKMLKSYLNFMDVYGPSQSRGAYGFASAHSPVAPPPIPFQSQYQSYHSSSQDMDKSVMGQYDRLKGNLASVDEEESTSPQSTELNLVSDHEDDESIAGDGVLGLLNNLYRK